jgi:hypothetical protein
VKLLIHGQGLNLNKSIQNLIVTIQTAVCREAAVLNHKGQPCIRNQNRVQLTVTAGLHNLTTAAGLHNLQDPQARIVIRNHQGPIPKVIPNLHGRTAIIPDQLLRVTPGAVTPGLPVQAPGAASTGHHPEPVLIQPLPDPAAEHRVEVLPVEEGNKTGISMNHLSND